MMLMSPLRRTVRHAAAVAITLASLASPATAFTTPAPQTQAAPRTLDVVLRPEYTGERIDALAVQITVQAPDLADGGLLFSMPTKIVSTPTMALGADAFTVNDAKGEFALEAVDQTPTPTSDDRHYKVTRATSGAVTIRYRVTPREVDSTTRNGPLFDLRRQGNGLMGAGVYFMPVIAGAAPYRIRLDWDLAKAPQGTRGIWSLGEGAHEEVSAAQTLPFSYYAVGPVQSIPAKSTGNFGFYWLTDMPLDFNQVAPTTQKMYEAMARFFGDEGKPYRVFVRSNPYRAGGGTAAARSFMFGVGVDGSSIDGGLSQLLAHEIAHTWPRLDEPNHAESSWYSEGMAEYYSLRLARRMGLMDDETYIDGLNQRLATYFTNPYLHDSSLEAGKKYWKDGRAQRIPYGRGLLYLLQVDARLRAAGETEGLDAMVLEVLRRQRAGGKVGFAEWVAMLEAHYGARAKTEFEAMQAGGKIELPIDALAPCFTTTVDRARGFELGYDDFSPGKITGLAAGSAAEAAGLKNGDVVEDFTPFAELKRDQTMHMKVRVTRDGKMLTFDYLPRREAVDTLRFERVSGAAPASCGF